MNCNFKRTTILKAYLYHLLASLPFVSFKKYAEKQNNDFVLVFNAITVCARCEDKRFYMAAFHDC